jgi:SPW repeat
MSRIETAAHAPPIWRTNEIALGILRHASGVALLLAAWVLVFTDHARAAASALLPGLLIVTLYGANQIRFRAVVERTVLIVGAWTIVAPWVLGFAASDGATLAHVALGSVAMATAASWLRIAGRP